MRGEQGRQRRARTIHDSFTSSLVQDPSAEVEVPSLLRAAAASGIDGRNLQGVGEGPERV